MMKKFINKYNEQDEEELNNMIEENIDDFNDENIQNDEFL